MANEVDQLRSDAARIGLSLNEGKCELISANILTSVPKQLSGFRRVLVQEATMLGAPLGDGPAMEEVWGKHKDNLDRAASRLCSLNSHDALVILKNSLSLPKLLFHLRCTFSGDHPILSLLDAKTREMLCQILNVDISDGQWDQASLPVKWGGLGIRRTVQVAPSAYLASVSGVTNLVQAILPCRLRAMPDALSDKAVALWRSLGGITPPPAHDSGVQKIWDLEIIRSTSSRLLDEAPDDYTKARLMAVAAPHAGDWLNAPPISAVGLRFSNEALRVAVGLRLGATICAPHTCRCTAPVNARGNHGLSCTKSAGRQMRHSLINNIISRALSRAGIAAKREPPGLVTGTNLRLDGATLIPWSRGKFLAWDATCPDTVAQSHITATCITAGAAASHAGHLKHQKYSDLAPSHHFVAVAVETFGPWNQEGSEFIKDLGRRTSTITGDPRESSFLFQRLSAAVQLGNTVSFAGTLPLMDEEEDG